MNRIFRRPSVIFATLTLAAALTGASAPAQARLPALGYGGPLSGGVFHGLPIRPPAVSTRANEVEAGLASTECQVMRQSVRDRLGTIVVRSVQVCD